MRKQRLATKVTKITEFAQTAKEEVATKGTKITEFAQTARSGWQVPMLRDGTGRQTSGIYLRREPIGVKR